MTTCGIQQLSAVCYFFTTCITSSSAIRWVRPTLCGLYFVLLPWKKKCKLKMCITNRLKKICKFKMCITNRLKKNMINNTPSTFLLRKEENVLFNDALNTVLIYGYMASDIWQKDHSDSERGNLLLPHRLLFPNSSKGCFICTIPQTG